LKKEEYVKHAMEVNVVLGQPLLNVEDVEEEEQ
jgi:hypothetical protein